MFRFVHKNNQEKLNRSSQGTPVAHKRAGRVIKVSETTAGGPHRATVVDYLYNPANLREVLNYVLKDKIKLAVVKACCITTDSPFRDNYTLRLSAEH